MTAANHDLEHEIQEMRNYWRGWQISDDGCTATRTLRRTEEPVIVTAPSPEALDNALYIMRGD